MLTLGHILELSAVKYPHRPALTCLQSNRHFTYQQWNEEVNRLANALLHLGIAKGDRISTFLDNSVELVTVLFAASKIGAVFNPVNRHLSPAELAFILNDVEARILVFGAAEKKRVDRARLKIKTVECYLYAGENPPGYAICYHRLTGGMPATKPETMVSENDWYAIMYTSGTTGKPKGVIHRHREILDHSMCMIESQKLTCHDRGLSVAPLYHAAELHCFFIPRVHIGAANILLADFQPRSLPEILNGEKITIMFADPARWRAILQHARGSCGFPHLRLLASGGAPVSPGLAAECRECFQTEMIHYYGMTEMGPAVTVLYPHEQATKAGSAGKALLNHELRVVKLNPGWPSDPDDVVEQGARGEIVVRGAGMMQGYYNRPEMTVTSMYGGWYHTGDVGAFDADGYLWISGRVDDAIICGVENIYPREIEEVLLEHPDILEVSVVGVENDLMETEIVAFIVSGGNTPTAKEINDFLRSSDKLAHYKIPVRYVFVEQLPGSVNGKIKKHALLESIKDGRLKSCPTS